MLVSILESEYKNMYYNSVYVYRCVDRKKASR